MVWRSHAIIIDANKPRRADRCQVMELFRRIVNERRAAVVVVTPDRRSEELFDRTFELSDGRIAEAPGLRLTEASMGD
jgi:ABC-type lipoprotein export system ATPase subunit